MSLPVPAFDLSPPGSILYDGPMASLGMRLNRFGQSMKIAGNRDAFKADPEAFLAATDLTADERTAVLSRDWTWLLSHGGHLQAMARIAAVDGQYLFHLAAHMCGVTAEEMQAACPRRVSGLDGLDG